MTMFLLLRQTLRPTSTATPTAAMRQFPGMGRQCVHQGLLRLRQGISTIRLAPCARHHSGPRDGTDGLRKQDQCRRFEAGATRRVGRKTARHRRPGPFQLLPFTQGKGPRAALRRPSREYHSDQRSKALALWARTGREASARERNLPSRGRGADELSRWGSKEERHPPAGAIGAHGSSARPRRLPVLASRNVALRGGYRGIVGHQHGGRVFLFGITSIHRISGRRRPRTGASRWSGTGRIRSRLKRPTPRSHRRRGHRRRVGASTRDAAFRAPGRSRAQFDPSGAGESDHRPRRRHAGTERISDVLSS